MFVLQAISRKSNPATILLPGLGCKPSLQELVAGVLGQSRLEETVERTKTKQVTSHTACFVIYAPG